MTTIEKIEDNLKKLCKNIDPKNFIFDFLLAYDQPKATINRLKKGDYNLSKKDNQVVWKKKLLYETIGDKEDVHDKIDDLSKDNIIEKNNIRFVIVTDSKLFLAIDKKTNQTLDINIKEIFKHSDFFLPLIGLEKIETIFENQADIKAAEKMGKLYDLIIKDNKDLLKSNRDRHGLNIFFTRILFCFFAEDSDIFLKGLFTNSISSHTEKDGRDLDIYLKKLFEVLNNKERKSYSEYLDKFPYVNGGLFSNEYKIPKFSKESRKILIESGELDWSSINPDILGSMMQAVVQQKKRDELGMHYTSVENILKIIKPLFLDQLYDDLIKSKKDVKKLNLILKKIYNLKIFDPACGSGNFLVISFKELCKLEIEIYKEIKAMDKNFWLIMKSGINLNQFYGIETDDYAHEAAKLSLWMAQHQMNIYFKEIFGETRPTLPLSPSGNIICKNSNNVDWDKFCQKSRDKKIYIIGNPPYLGSTWQSKNQREDMNKVFTGIKNYKNLDYISCWFLKGAKYIYNSNAELAFVSTNSVTQGEQVSSLWPHILRLNLEINFAYKSFHWKNNARAKAGVTCVIISLINKSNKPKKLFTQNKYIISKNINPYLINMNLNTIIHRTIKPLFNKPKMLYGNKPTDEGNFILTYEEKEQLLEEDEKSKKFIKKYIGAQEFIKGIRRWCLWINDDKKDEALSIKSIAKRVLKVQEFRSKSTSKNTREAIKKSHRFIGIQHEPDDALIIPCVSSGERKYIPIGFVNSEYVINNNAHAIYRPENYIFTFVSSKMHMSWVNTVSGRLRSDFNYSSSFCYNPFPIPKLDQNQKKMLQEKTLEIIDIREQFSEMTIAELYNNETMPEFLFNKHKEIDKIVDSFYSKKIIENDDERIKILFEMYDNKENRNLLF